MSGTRSAFPGKVEIIIWHYGRVVKATDLKSVGLCPRMFKSCWCRIFYFSLEHPQKAASVILTQETSSRAPFFSSVARAPTHPAASISDPLGPTDSLCGSSRVRPWDHWPSGHRQPVCQIPQCRFPISEWLPLRLDHSFDPLRTTRPRSRLRLQPPPGLRRSSCQLKARSAPLAASLWSLLPGFQLLNLAETGISLNLRAQVRLNCLLIAFLFMRIAFFFGDPNARFRRFLFLLGTRNDGLRNVIAHSALFLFLACVSEWICSSHLTRKLVYKLLTYSKYLLYCNCPCSWFLLSLSFRYNYQPHTYAQFTSCLPPLNQYL